MIAAEADAAAISAYEIRRFCMSSGYRANLHQYSASLLSRRFDENSGAVAEHFGHTLHNLSRIIADTDYRVRA